MSGYLGNPDAEAEHALILSENGVYAAREALSGSVLTHCLECGEEIDPKRVSLARKIGMKCELCIECQRLEDQKPKSRVKMLDWVL